MKTITLIKNGAAATAFDVREQPIPTPTATQVCVKVEAFGLNYADVMARLGLYEDAPPLPAVLGYEVVGRVTAIGSSVTNCNIGDRVVAMTRFGGYAEYAVTECLAMAHIPETMDVRLPRSAHNILRLIMRLVSKQIFLRAMPCSYTRQRVAWVLRWCKLRKAKAAKCMQPAALPKKWLS